MITTKQRLWLGAFTACIFVVSSFIIVFPGVVGLDRHPTIVAAMPMALSMFLLALFLGTLAATRLGSDRNKEMRLLLAAKKYVSDQMTLEQYGAETKQLLEDKRGRADSGATGLHGF
jgi:hypothetical protein